MSAASSVVAKWAMPQAAHAAPSMALLRGAAPSYEKEGTSDSPSLSLSSHSKVASLHPTHRDPPLPPLFGVLDLSRHGDLPPCSRAEAN
jgi:hypothetical protein